MSIKFVPVEERHLEVVFAYRQDPLTLQHNPVIQMTFEAFRDATLKAAPASWALFDVLDKLSWVAEFDGRPVGAANLQNINRIMKTAEIGYGVFPSERGKGFSTQIIRKFSEEAFANTPLRRLFATIAEQNLRSRRAVEKAGYRLEGTLREHYLINGRPVNECVYGLLRSEFSGL